MRKKIIVTAFLLTQALSQNAHSSGYIYIYKQPDGDYLFTDRGVHKPYYQLLKRMYKPQAPATTSCMGASSYTLHKRARLYDPEINRIALADHLDPLLIKAIISVESCFDTHATSTAGAMGLMQLMPETAVHLGISHLYNPVRNLDAGMRYFSKMMSEFSNNVSLALAAYNAGPGAVIKYNGIPPYPQTENYVQRVIHNYHHLLAQSSGN